MFLRSLTIENDKHLIRNINFQKGINLIIDETPSDDKRKSGNNVGKTTVLRLIDFCLGGNGENIYKDTEFEEKGNTRIEKFLKENNVIITLQLCADILDEKSRKIIIKRNFLKRKEKVLKIDNVNYKTRDFLLKLKEKIFFSKVDKPKFRQIISKNIRYEKNRLANTLKILDSFTKKEEYEALYLYWLGIELNTNAQKQKFLRDKIAEENLQIRLKRENSLSQIKQSIIVLNRNIKSLEEKKATFNLNRDYEKDVEELNSIKSKINSLNTNIGILEMRRSLAIESKNELENEYSNIDTKQIELLYQEANVLIPKLQKTFEQTLKFHNEMITEKLKYITEELPDLEKEIENCKTELKKLLESESILTETLRKTGTFEELEGVIKELNILYEKKGGLEEKKRIWEASNAELSKIEKELEKINEEINSKDDLIQGRIADFNKYFTDFSSKLYNEQFVLSSDKNDRGYELKISSLSGNLGTGKKKGQIAAFDLAYINFADYLDMKCLHFILHDQIENIHSNQISNLLNEIVANINCQFILPVLRDKLPKDIDIDNLEILSLSQSNKLFKID